MGEGTREGWLRPPKNGTADGPGPVPTLRVAGVCCDDEAGGWARGAGKSNGGPSGLQTERKRIAMLEVRDGGNRAE